MALRKYKEFRFANDILYKMVTVTELHPYVKSKAYYLKLIHQKKLMPHAITYSGRGINWFECTRSWSEKGDLNYFLVPTNHWRRLL